MTNSSSNAQLHALAPYQRVARIARAVGQRIADLKSVLYGFEDQPPSLGISAIEYEACLARNYVRATQPSTPPTQRAIHEIYRLRALVNDAFESKYRPDFAGVSRHTAMAAWYQSRVRGLSTEEVRTHADVNLERRAYLRAMDEADAAVVAVMSAVDYQTFERLALMPDENTP